ncbi:O-antigen ligase family protein [Thermodesulfovibrio yellowstonii]|uniref:O-Antigen Polymerase family n=1 Tax=Thermodesulfovibrio yellowstonii (strain ATCC 51303 / DSM 11347 / YP87) TaxID=289376 RepID=B5YJ59_THEYD|nr:O-antigen ligase family protein [Thermodesulfovibrio yellowstonii]ACI20928.1 O-Antigen Polymerase family [Thermodesulfovibrio yellowstonii DSM 11347]
MKQVDKIIIIFLSILILVLPVAHTATIRSIALWTPFILLILRFYREKNFKFIKTSFEVPFLVFFVIALLSFFTSVNPKETIKEIRGELITPILLFYLVYYAIKKEENALLLMRVLFFSSIIFSLYSFYDFYRNGGNWFSVTYKAGGFRDPGGGEVAALYHTMVIPFIFWGLIYLQDKKQKFFLILALVINLLALHITFVRAGIIALGLHVFFSSLLLLKEKKFFISLLLVILLSILTFVYIEKKMFREMHTERIPSISEYFKMKPEEIAGYNPSSMKQRLAMWKTAIDKISENPFYPHGYGRFLFGKTVRNENNKHFIYPQTHNTFIGIAFELGIQGLIVFLWMITAFFIVCLKYWLKSQDTLIKYFSASLMTMMVGYWVNNFFGSFDGDDSKLLFMMLLGIGMAVMHRIPREREIVHQQ